MQHRRPALIGALFLGLCSPLLAQDRYEPKPLPAGPDAPTAQKSLERHIAFYREMYSKACAVEPAWQPHLGALLDLSSKVLVGVARDDEEKVRAEIACDRLRELGCEDPVVRLMMADACRLRKRFDDAKQHLQVAKNAFKARPPVGLLSFVPIVAESNLLWDSGQEERYHQHWPAVGRALPELVRATEFDGGHERWLVPLIKMVARPDDPKSERILSDLEKVAGRPVYALLVVRAEHHVKMAWAARGTKLARDVGEDNFRTFGDHMEKAAEAAIAAYELCPQHPEAPSTMISVLGPIGGQNDEMRMWLDRTVAAEFDHLDAYETYLHYLQPRWGGSHRLQLQFGLECLRTGRFDTDVPHQYRGAIHHIAKDGSAPHREWAKASVQKRLAELDAGYMAEPRSSRNRSFHTTHWIYTMCLADHAAEAAGEYEKRGILLRAGFGEYYNVPESWIWKQLIPHLTKFEPATVERRDLFRGFEQAQLPRGEQGRELREVLRTAKNSPLPPVAWLTTTLLAAYDRAGVHDPRWDDEVRALLREFAGVAYGTRAPTEETRQRIGRLVAAECKDPLTRYVIDRLQPGDNLRERLRELGPLQSQIQKDHSPVFAWWVSTHVRSLLTGTPQQKALAKAEQSEIAAAAAAANDPLFAGDGRPDYVRNLTRDLDTLQVPNAAELVQRLAEQPNVDPWLVHMVTGLHHSARARYDELDDDACRTELLRAAEHLQKAHALCPQFPEAATVMIRVAAQLADPKSPTPRHWFEQAVAVECGATAPFFAYLESLHPDYGGSALAMYRFGVECLDTGRFDSQIPFTYFRALQAVQEALPEARLVWAANGVAERLERLFEGYLTQETPVLPVAELQTFRCAAAWAGGRPDLALQAWRDNGESLVARVFPLVGNEDAELIEILLRKHAESRRRK